MIDILALLEAKTRGNLTAEERNCWSRFFTSCAAVRRGEQAAIADHHSVPEPHERMRPGPSVVKAPIAARVTMLGTGTSHGRADDRLPLRDLSGQPTFAIVASAVDLYRSPERARILVDTATDLRQQALAHRHSQCRCGSLHPCARGSHPRASTI
jgi:hypothetical protein